MRQKTSSQNEKTKMADNEPQIAETTEAGSANSAAKAAQEARSAHVASNISSSLSGNRVGNMVGDKKMGLLEAMHDAKPQVGRRPTPVHDPWPRRKLFIRGIGLCLLVCVIVAVLVIVFAQQGDLGAGLL